MASVWNDWLTSYISMFLLLLANAEDTVPQTKTMSMDKQILDAAPNAQMFDVFHVMPDSNVMVMHELDLLLTMDQYKSLYGNRISSDPVPGEDRDKSDKRKRFGRALSSRRKRFFQREKRKADNSISVLWPNCRVYYEVEDSFTDEDRKNLNAAIKEWGRYTCLSFIESSTETSRLQFKNGGGCYSQLGRQSKPQPVALAPKCRTKGIIAHEIGHAIGWYHEHMRPDRDSYIHVNFDVIPHRYKINFEKYTSEKINTFGVEYDYTSLMHYGTDALPGSITALDPDFQEKMGQRVGLTFKDIKLANVMYKCAEVMACRPLIECPHGGFQFYKRHKGEDPCKCWCDSGNVDDPLVLCSEVEAPPPKPNPRPTETPIVSLCYDVREDCDVMKAKGFCMSKLDLMMDACMKTCGFCGTDSDGDDNKTPPAPCMDHDKACALLATTGLCGGLDPIMSKQCPASCGLCPSPPDPCKIQQEVMGHGYSDAHPDFSEGAGSRLSNVHLIPLVIGAIMTRILIF